MLNKQIPENGMNLGSLEALGQRLEEVTLPAVQAANAENYEQEQMKARRLRRQTRLSRQTSRQTGGWTTRLW